MSEEELRRKLRELLARMTDEEQLRVAKFAREMKGKEESE